MGDDIGSQMRDRRLTQRIAELEQFNERIVQSFGMGGGRENKATP